MAEVKNYKLYNKLANIVNNTFGQTGPGTTQFSTQKVNLILLNEKMLEARYQGIVTFTSGRILDGIQKKFFNEGMGLIDSTLQKVQETYKDSNPGQRLKFEIKTDTCIGNVEYIHANNYSPVRRAFYRVKCLVIVEEENG